MWVDKSGNIKGFSQDQPDKMVKAGLVFMVQSLVSGKSCACGWYGTASVSGDLLVDYGTGRKNQKRLEFFV